MALSPAEEIEYQRLKRQEQLDDDAGVGGQQLASIDSRSQTIRASRPQPPQGWWPWLKQEFHNYSPTRVIVGWARDALSQALDSSADATEGINNLYQHLGASPGVARALSGSYFQTAVKSIAPAVPGHTDVSGETRIDVPDLKGSDQAGGAEKLSRSVGAFLIPYTGMAKGLGVARAATWVGRAGLATLAAGVTDAAFMKPVENNLAQTIKNHYGLHGPVLDQITDDLGPDDDPDNWDATRRLKSRLKTAVANAPAGLAGEVFFDQLGRLVRMYKAWRGTSEEAAAITSSVKDDIRVKRIVAKGDTPLRAANDEAVPVISQPASTLPPTARKGALPKAANDGSVVEAAPPANSAADLSLAPAAPRPVENFQDVLDYLKEKAPAASAVPVDGTLKDVGREGVFNARAMFDDPENALQKLGVDPVKLDFRSFDDPHAYANLVEGLADVFMPISRELGRTGQVVSETQIIKSARALASKPETLRDLYAGTSNLAERLTGARMLVGAHAHKLLSLGQAARAEITSGVTDGPAWTDFLETLHRHAYYIGEVRGAQTEVGRALRSLQIIAKVNDGRAAAAAASTANRAVAPVAEQVKQDLADYAATVRTYGSPEERLGLLDKLDATGGDLNAMSRFARRENMAVGQRIGAGLRETVGNLFSPATAALNVASGFTQLGLRGLAKGLAGVSRMALSQAGIGDANLARVRLMQSHAYFHGIISGFGDAFRETLAVAEKEGLSEAALHADTLGFKDLGQELRARSNAAEDALAMGNYERTEVKTHRAIALNPEEQASLNQMIDTWDGPKFFQEGLKGLVKLFGTTINGIGSASRLQTTAFINMPDQFVGVLAARAGRHAQAVEIAAAEAAEAELEGKALKDYLKARSVELADGDPSYFPDDPFEAGAKLALDNAGETEARGVLFQDALERPFNQRAARFLGSGPVWSLLVPFVRTPLRILEQTALDYTPLGFAAGRLRRGIVAGGIQRDEAMARMALGLTAMGIAYSLAGDRTIVGADGAYKSSARLTRPSFTLKVGGDYVEFGRLDPLGTLMGLAADFRTYMDEAADDPDREKVEANLGDMAKAAVLAVSANVLNKTWLTSVRNLVELASADTSSKWSVVEGAGDGFVQNLASRLIPASGSQKQIEKWDDGAVREAFSFNERLLRNTIGADKLPLKRDQLGRPITSEAGDRLIGVRVGPHSSPEDDPLAAEFERLSFDLPLPRKTLQGVDLTSAQYSRYLELRGQVVKQDGLTMDQALTAMVQEPAYKALSRDLKVEAIRQTMSGYGSAATDALLKEDKGFAYDALKHEVYVDAHKNGAPPEQRDAALAKLAQQLGLQPPSPQ